MRTHSEGLLEPSILESRPLLSNKLREHYVATEIYTKHASSTSTIESGEIFDKSKICDQHLPIKFKLLMRKNKRIVKLDPFGVLDQPSAFNRNHSNCKSRLHSLSRNLNASYVKS